MEITVGHERRLKALGLSAEWYQEVFERLGGKCERCGRSETIRHYSQVKPLAVDTSMNPPRLLCEKCNALKNQKNKRRRDEEKRIAAEERANNMTRDEFWETNRRSLKKSERERLEQRTAEILFLCDVMDDYVNGTDGTTEQDLQDTITEVAAEVAQHGLCDLNVALIEWWKPWEKDFYDAVVAKGGTEKFVKYGYIDAIPSDVYHRFASKFMQKPTNPTPKPEWVTLTCTTPGCGQGLQAMPRETANEFASKSIKPFCYCCIDAERKSIAQATSTVLGVTGQERDKMQHAISKQPSYQI